MLPRGQRQAQLPKKPHALLKVPETLADSSYALLASRCIIGLMLGGRTSSQWVAQYATSHQHPINRACHTLGIPLILLSIAVFVSSIFIHRLWPYALALFVSGWIFQFIGHAFEGKPPEFFSDWRFLFVGVRWWWAKIRGKA